MKLLDTADLSRLIKNPCVAETQLFLAELSKAVPEAHYSVKWWGFVNSSPRQQEEGLGNFAVCTVTLVNNTCHRQFRACAGNFFFAVARHTEHWMSPAGGRIDIRPRTLHAD